MSKTATATERPQRVNNRMVGGMGASFHDVADASKHNHLPISYLTARTSFLLTCVALLRSRRR
jgi:hypothetical protein